MLINEAVEVLVEEEEAGTYEGRVREVQLTLCHVCNLQRHSDTQRAKKALLHQIILNRIDLNTNRGSLRDNWPKKKTTVIIIQFI